jgi:hypothetical protein
MKKPYLSLLLLLTFLLFAQGALAAEPLSKLQGSHGDQELLPRSCQACHPGMSFSNNGEENSCLQCHGSDVDRNRMSASQYLRAGGVASLQDIATELRKPYRHPVFEVRGAHRFGEILPEELLNAFRHSECVDCHDPHVTGRGRPFAGIQGRRVGNLITEIVNEYELCFKCHSTSANLPQNSTDKAEEFRTTNPSFHPLLAEGKQAFVVSLKTPYAARKNNPNDITMISCTDCHGSDDKNGPKGPHGSNYRGLLKYNYQQEDGRAESVYEYALCYQCHDRTSILNNESFAFHALHIQGNRASGQAGTSCMTCHDAHGSSSSPYLIRFNETIVKPNAENKLEYEQIGVSARQGKCSLNCHGVEHKERAY